MKTIKENSSFTNTSYYCHKLHTSSTYTKRPHIYSCYDKVKKYFAETQEIIKKTGFSATLL